MKRAVNSASFLPYITHTSCYPYIVILQSIIHLRGDKPSFWNIRRWILISPYGMLATVNHVDQKSIEFLKMYKLACVPWAKRDEQCKILSCTAESRALWQSIHECLTFAFAASQLSIYLYCELCYIFAQNGIRLLISKCLWIVLCKVLDINFQADDKLTIITWIAYRIIHAL